MNLKKFKKERKGTIEESTIRIGLAIKKNRQLLGLNQHQLSEKIGISRSIISAHEAGLRRPGKKYIAIYNAFFATDITRDVHSRKLKHDIQVSFRVNRVQYERIAMLAKSEAMDMSSCIRVLLEKVLDHESLSEVMQLNQELIAQAVAEQFRLKRKDEHDLRIELLYVEKLVIYLLQYSQQLSDNELYHLCTEKKKEASDEIYRKLYRRDE